MTLNQSAGPHRTVYCTLYTSLQPYLMHIEAILYTLQPYLDAHRGMSATHRALWRGLGEDPRAATAANITVAARHKRMSCALGHANDTLPFSVFAILRAARETALLVTVELGHIARLALLSGSGVPPSDLNGSVVVPSDVESRSGSGFKIHQMRESGVVCCSLL